MKKILIPIGILVVGTVKSQLTPLPNTENYIQTKTYLDYNGTQATKSAETVQYFDGLGRAKQVVNVKASPLGRDIVTPIVYDNFGRQTRDYLPVPQSGTQNGTIYPQTPGMVNFPVSDATGIYTGEKIYSEKVLENSPLDRIQQQIQVGNAWSTKPVKFEYSAVSVNDQVRKFTTVTTWENGATKSVLGENWLYTDNQLYKNTVTDEDGNKTIEFKNGNGQLIMVRKEDESSTYYVYNEYDQLAFVIPPIASMRGDIVPNTTKQDELCYQYRYDGRGRLVEKKLPGKGWESMIYDKQDRLVATQDAELKLKGQWLYTQYDQFGRVVITGINTGGERNAEQILADGSGNLTRTGSAVFNRQGMDVFYDPGVTYPHASKWVTLLSLNYYESYPSYGFNPALPANTPEMTVLTATPTSDGRSTKGLPVMSFVKNIEDDNWTKNYTYYDQKARVIGTHSINHLGGYTRTESKLDFAGLPLQTITRHKRLTSDTERVITETFEYDSQNRLLVHKHQVDNNPVEYLTQNKYNELTQLESKKVGGIAAASPLQQIDYRYNIRGWMTRINDPSNLNGKLFGYEIRYHNPANTQIVGRYNGNIAEIDWNNGSENLLKRYDYEYDKVNRLTKAFYKEPSTGVSGTFDEHLTYDLNGNIGTLKRWAVPVYGLTSTLVDNLEYKYTGNRLNQVVEYAMNDAGYEGGNNLIDYNLNGNMINMKDKGINTIKYNYLNLPNAYSIYSNRLGLIRYEDLGYLYRADGTKLRKIYSTTPPRGITSTTITDYLDGFQYTYREGGGICLECRTASAFEEQAYKSIGQTLPDLGETPTWKLDFVATSEGAYNFMENRYIYQYKDHLGNVRVSFAKNNEGILEVMDTNNYYPFGLNHITGMVSLSNLGGLYSYKYNGKELQETGMYDYGARFYMPDIGRWGVVDPAAELGRRFSLYNYAFDNPVMFIDPDGMWPWPTWKQVKSFANGFARGAGNAITGIVSSGVKYNPVTMGYAGIHDTYQAGKKVYGAYKHGGAKAAVGEAGNILYESTGAKALAQTAKGVAKGDPESIGSAAVIVASGKALSKAGGMKRMAAVEAKESSNLISAKSTAPQAGESLSVAIKDGNISVGGSGNGRFDFVVTESGEFKAGSGHYYLSGEANNVQAAGQIILENGIVTDINNISGHYAPTVVDANSYKSILSKSGVDISKAKITKFGE